MRTVAAVGVAMLLGAGGAYGQSYALDWSSIDGGGGTSTNAQYTLTGSIGQPEGGVMSGGTFVLEGGFWPGALIVDGDEQPTMVITLLPGGTSVRITWEPETPGFTLERTADLAAPSWAPAPAGDQPITDGAMFYRLKK